MEEIMDDGPSKSKRMRMRKKKREESRKTKELEFQRRGTSEDEQQSSEEASEFERRGTSEDEDQSSEDDKPQPESKCKRKTVEDLPIGQSSRWKPTEEPIAVLKDSYDETTIPDEETFQNIIAKVNQAGPHVREKRLKGWMKNRRTRANKKKRKGLPE